MSNPGGELRQARERAHLSLRDIRERTKIRVSLLEAIEREQFDRLPAGLLTRGYLRAFAREVGLDPESIVQAYRSTYEAELPRASETADGAASPAAALSSQTTVALVLLAAAVLVVFLGSRTLRSGDADSPMTAADDVPDGAVRADGFSDEVPAAFADGVAGASPVATGGGALRLELHATALVWVDAMADGDRAVRELLPPGARRTVDAQDAISLRIGDAGGFSYSINGRPGRPLGNRGQVRSVRITRDNYAEFIAD